MIPGFVGRYWPLLVALSGVLYLYHTIDSLGTQLGACRAELTRIDAVAAEQKRRYEVSVRNYEDAIIKTANAYEEDIRKIEEFKGEANETSCQSAERMFDGFSY